MSIGSLMPESALPRFRVIGLTSTTAVQRKGNHDDLRSIEFFIGLRLPPKESAGK